MAEPRLAFTRLAGAAGSGSLLVVGPSLGTSVEALWQRTADLLGDTFEVVGWDLPGHGRSAAAAEPFSIADLAEVVRNTAAGLVQGGRQAAYAGVSLAGAVGLELATDPGVFTAVASVASAARIGEPSGWQERAALVRRAGTPVMVSGSAQRWFAPGFIERDPTTANRLLHALSDADSESYAMACDALSSFDLRARLGDVRVELLVVAGAHDGVVTPELAGTTAAASPGARLEVLAGCAHLPPAEDPAGTAQLIREMVKEAAHG